MVLKVRKRKKKTDKELFARLRYNTITIGLASLVILVFNIYTEYITEQVQRIIFFVAGAVLLYSGFEKYLENNPKVKRVLMWILIGLMFFGIGVFLYAIIKMILSL